jgi:hypothetical protein
MKHVKVGDFGLAQILFPADYYQSSSSAAPVPIRWMAPETLQDHVLLTSAGDIWFVAVNVTYKSLQMDMLIWISF